MIILGVLVLSLIFGVTAANKLIKTVDVDSKIQLELDKQNIKYLWDDEVINIGEDLYNDFCYLEAGKDYECERIKLSDNYYRDKVKLKETDEVKLVNLLRSEKEANLIETQQEKYKIKTKRIINTGGVEINIK